MKFKTLRTKREPKEFVELHFHKDPLNPDKDCCDIYTSELPNPLPLTATIEGMKQYYSEYHPLPVGIDLDDYELIEFEAYEVNTVGADIRNKLSSPLNLAVMIEIYLADPEKNIGLLSIIKEEIGHTKISVEYIANLL